ncbi:MAG: hypothetical protein QMD46_03225 [Methanomicrobiales archaeon]|nr:hypothetical protein [Methanomicrobiales archaeon]
MADTAHFLIAHCAVDGKVVVVSRRTVPGRPAMGCTARPGRELGRAFAAFSLLAASIVLFWRDNAILLALSLLLGAAALALWHDRYDLSVFAIVAVLGTAAELVFVSAGVWRYANPSLFGIPLWFPPAFGTAALCGERVVRGAVGLWNPARAS